MDCFFRNAIQEAKPGSLYNGRFMTDFSSISELAARLRRGDISPVEITQRCLDRIEKLNPALNAFITVMAESARAQAQRAEDEILAGEWRGALHGVPVALKDLIDTAGVRTTAASALYKDRVPEQDAEVVRRLRLAGAVIIGKNNLHEFAYGGSSLVSYFGDVHNPWDVARIAGDRRAGRRRRWWRGWLTRRLGLTRRDRFANRRRCVGAWG